MSIQLTSSFRLGDPKYFIYEGIRYNKYKDIEVIEELRQHTFDPADILVASFPKSGNLNPLNSFEFLYYILLTHEHANFQIFQ